MEYAREVRLAYGKRRRRVSGPLSSPDAAAAFFRSIVPKDDLREHLAVVGVDARNRPQVWFIASIGTMTTTLVHPREVFAPVLTAGCVAVIVAHNHPTGDPKPSAEDVSVTNRLVQAGHLLGVPLLDHLVLGEGNFTSLKEAGHVL